MGLSQTMVAPITQVEINMNHKLSKLIYTVHILAEILSKGLSPMIMPHKYHSMSPYMGMGKIPQISHLCFLQIFPISSSLVRKHGLGCDDESVHDI